MKHSGISTAYMSKEHGLAKELVLEEELKVLKDQESFKNTTIQLKYKEDLQETKNG